MQLAECAIQNRINKEPALAWWAPHVIKKKKHIVAKVKSKCWTRTHKFGIRTPKTVEEAKRIDEAEDNTLWWDAICTEMKNVRVAFELFEGTADEPPPGCQMIDCHMIFDIKIGKGF